MQVTPTPSLKPRVAMVQRAIAHYRLPLFEKLARETPYEWIFYSSNQDIATGVSVGSFDSIRVRQIRNRRLIGPFVFQTGVSLGANGLAALMLDLGWPLVSNPRYLLEAKMRGIATIGWSKGLSQELDKRDTFAKRFYQKFILSLCDVLVVYGKTSMEYFRALDFPADRIFVAQNAVDTRRIADELSLALNQRDRLRELLPVNGRFVFGYLGALIPRKKVDSIIEAFERVRSMDSNAVLIIAGSGSSGAGLQRRAVASPYARDILMVGRVPPGEEGGYFQLFDAYLSFAEAGLGVIEAMAHGRLIISTPEKYPETELLRDNENALLARDFTVDALAERMSFAMTHRDLLPEIGAKAREVVLREATLENMVQSISRAVEAAVRTRS